MIVQVSRTSLKQCEGTFSLISFIPVLKLKVFAQLYNIIHFFPAKILMRNIEIECFKCLLPLESPVTIVLYFLNAFLVRMFEDSYSKNHTTINVEVNYYLLMWIKNMERCMIKQ